VTSQIPRLKNSQYDNIVRDILGVTALASGALPSSLLNTDSIGAMNTFMWDAYQNAARTIAAEVMGGANRGNFIACEPSAANCLQDTIVAFGRKAFRRPLTEAEVTRFMALGSTTPDATVVPLTIQPGKVSALDNILPALFNRTGVGGSVVVDAPAAAPLVLTARTFSREADGGTYGQFIPGITASQAAGVGELGVELMQLERSDFYRTNVGIFEVTGKPVQIEILAESPQGKITRGTTAFLSAHEFTQYDVFGSLGFGTVYNGRITIRVIGGEGRISAYGSVIDSRTADPTYVPAQ
jgi:hypothetical protein